MKMSSSRENQQDCFLCVHVSDVGLYVWLRHVSVSDQLNNNSASRFVWIIENKLESIDNV